MNLIKFTQIMATVGLASIWAAAWVVLYYFPGPAWASWLIIAVTASVYVYVTNRVLAEYEQLKKLLSNVEHSNEKSN